jgi:hypothetical protein
MRPLYALMSLLLVHALPVLGAQPLHTEKVIYGPAAQC